ncbi:MAG: glycosyltransferase family A protein, partial [bacterium]|nr:glycosyltransferase family A protein [bacterium]
MLNNLRVSVVIPAYNEERYIKRCLESLMEQEVLPDEIIVVDNNCT